MQSKTAFLLMLIVIVFLISVNLPVIKGEVTDTPSNDNPSDTSNAANVASANKQIVVRLYRDKNYGDNWNEYEEGDSIPNFKMSSVIGNDAASSIRVTQGYKATVCEHINYAGFCRDFTGDFPNFKYISCCGGNFDDKASSITVSRICSPLEGQQCNCNACGCGGTFQCDGVTCSGDLPGPSNYNQDCGSCGGKINCDGNCNVITPSNFGGECNCNACGCGGTFQCDGTCSGIVPSCITETYYCRQDAKFVTDLDTPPDKISDTELNNKNKATCEKAGFKWTGAKCCSEDDDNLTTSTLREFYNDIGGIGGCWNSTLAISISLVNGTNNSIINYDGGFHGCVIDKRNYNKNNDNLLHLIDKHTGNPLIKGVDYKEYSTNHDYCFNEPENNYYCSYTEKWLLTEGADKTHLSFAPIANPNQTAECCAQSECWNGEKCIQNQRANPLAQPIGDGYRCIDGNWIISTLKFTPDDIKSGYCPKESQCLIDPLAKNESYQCINSTQYVNDDYCQDGTWFTRTELLESKLLNLKPSGDYVLFCDNRENALNNIKYLTKSAKSVSDILANLQTNNFCVLSSGSQIIAASSINGNIEQLKSAAPDAFKIRECQSSAFVHDGEYHSCDLTNTLWVNKNLKTFIYSTTGINVPSGQELPSPVVSYGINGIKSSIKRLITSPPLDESYLNSAKKFDRIYLAQQGGKSIIGSIEGDDIKNIVIKYAGFDNDLCGAIEAFNKAKKDKFSGISCKKESNSYYALAQGSKFTSLNPESIWQDLTSKLRP